MAQNSAAFKFIYCIAAICVLGVSTGFQPVAKQQNAIVLGDEPKQIVPREFYVAEVVDERQDKSAVAWLMPVTGTDSGPVKAVATDLQGGGLVAIKQFISHNIVRNRSLRPVIIRLKRINVSESFNTAGQVQGRVAVAMSFDLKQEDDDPVHLVDYNGSANYTRNAGPAQAIEPILRNALVYAFNYLNTWMDKQADGNIKLAKGVKVNFSDHTEKDEGDTVYYAANRPLKWADFKGKIQGGSRYDAEVFASIGYTEHVEVIKGIVNVNLAMKTYLPKSACWVRNGVANDHSLNHEQRHFDIAKLVTEHFKKKIKAETLPVGNYDGTINVEYFETLRELDRMQKQYDGETRHGNDQYAQARWDEKIDKELRSMSE